MQYQKNSRNKNKTVEIKILDQRPARAGAGSDIRAHGAADYLIWSSGVLVYDPLSWEMHHVC